MRDSWKKVACLKEKTKRESQKKKKKTDSMTGRRKTPNESRAKVEKWAG